MRRASMAFFPLESRRISSTLSTLSWRPRRVPLQRLSPNSTRISKEVTSSSCGGRRRKQCVELLVLHWLELIMLKMSVLSPYRGLKIASAQTTKTFILQLPPPFTLIHTISFMPTQHSFRKYSLPLRNATTPSWCSKVHFSYTLQIQISTTTTWSSSVAIVVAFCDATPSVWCRQVNLPLAD